MARLRKGSSPGGRGGGRTTAGSSRAQASVPPSSTGDAGRGGPQGLRRGPASPGRRRRGRIARPPRGPRCERHGQVATGVGSQARRGDAGRFRRRASFQATSWRKGVTRTGCIFPPQPRPEAASNFLLGASRPLSSFDVPKEDAAAQPRELRVPPTHPVSRAAAGWRNPLRTTGPVDSRFGAPGQVGGGQTRKAGAG